MSSEQATKVTGGLGGLGLIASFHCAPWLRRENAYHFTHSHTYIYRCILFMYLHDICMYLMLIHMYTHVCIHVDISWHEAAEFDNPIITTSRSGRLGSGGSVPQARCYRNAKGVGHEHVRGTQGNGTGIQREAGKCSLKVT